MIKAQGDKRACCPAFSWRGKWRTNQMKVSKKETQLTASDRLPYEKFLQKGAESLSDAELLAIMLRTGPDPGPDAPQAFRDCPALALAEQVLSLLRSFGIASVVPERLMDVVVGVSGSSPAYVFMFIEAMADEAVAAGMPRKQAYEFAAQSVLGSAKMVLETGKHPGELKDMVCSPGGTTIQAVKVLEEKGMRAAVMDAMDACIEKSKCM